MAVKGETTTESRGIHKWGKVCVFSRAMSLIFRTSSQLFSNFRVVMAEVVCATVDHLGE